MSVTHEKSPSRYSLRILVRFHLLEDSSEGTEFTSETVNISWEALFMCSSQRINLGSLLALRLKVPTEISGSPFCELRCTGRIVSEQQFPDGTFGYDVAFEEVSPPFKRFPTDRRLREG